MIFLLIILNFAISIYNAWVCGSVWDASRAKGGVAHAMTWAGAIMSASGFTWCYLIALAFLAAVTPQALFVHSPEGTPPVTGMLLSLDALQATLELGYVVIILPILGSGLAITVDSWRRLATSKDRNVGDYAITGWNTYAQASNMYNAARELPGIFDHLSAFFGGALGGASKSKDDNKGKALILVVALVVCAVLAGALTTYSIINMRRRDVRLAALAAA